ncbi:MAG: fatty acid--CoA ligase [Planctomycetota bacterium]
MIHNDDARTLADLPRVHARRGAKAALVFGERRTTFAELDIKSNQVANALLADGIAPGARIAILGKDSDRAFEILFGIAKVAGVSNGVNWRLAPAEIVYIINDSGAEILFVNEDCIKKAGDIADQLTTIRKIITISGRRDGWESYESWRNQHSTVDPQIATDPEDAAVQMYTSGTTGRPKGVQLAHRSFFAIVSELKRHGDPWIGWNESDVALHNIPAFHIGGLWWAMTALSAGATLIIMDAFVANAAIELIARNRVTKACMVPAMIQMCISEPAARTAHFSSLQYIVYGGSPIPTPLLTSAMQIFKCKFAQIYGLTETGNTAVCLRAPDHDISNPARLRAAGKAYPGVDICCIDRSGNRLAPGQIGEICIKSPANMIGYWKQPEATSKTLVNGWIHTGDAGYLDADGYVYICDRVKDMIISAGENIYPAEIENILCSHDAVAEAAVIGVPDERWGEQVKAFVVLKPGARASAGEILSFARKSIADFKVPRSVVFVDSLPRTPSGKVKKRELREPFWQGRDRQVN